MEILCSRCTETYLKRRFPHYALLVDIRNHQLIDNVTQLKTKGNITQITFGSISTIDPKSRHHQLFTKFSELTSCLPNTTAKTHGVEHHIVTIGQPPASLPKRFSPEKLKAAKTEFSYMMEQGICRLSFSQYAFLLTHSSEERS